MTSLEDSSHGFQPLPDLSKHDEDSIEYQKVLSFVASTLLLQENQLDPSHINSSLNRSPPPPRLHLPNAHNIPNQLQLQPREPIQCHVVSHAMNPPQNEEPFINPSTTLFEVSLSLSLSLFHFEASKHNPSTEY